MARVRLQASTLSAPRLRPSAASRQEVRRAHPYLERAEGVLPSRGDGVWLGDPDPAAAARFRGRAHAAIA